MNHTQGKWQRGEQHESKVEIVSVKDGKLHATIARVGIPLPHSLDYKEMQANADLIASAPELLRRYRWLVDKVIAPDYGDNDQGRKGYFIQHCKGPNWIGGETIDAAIDEAIAKESEGR